MSLLDGMGLSSEAEVLRRVRDGDTATYGVLYERHLGAARRLARSLLADASDADDVVAEVFAATFAAMRKGRGPADDFRSYVLTSVRRECHRAWRRGGRQRPGGEQVIDLAAARAGDRDEIAQHTEDEVVHHAFASLPPHMREVLWASEVENRCHGDIAARTGSSSAAVAQLIVRARRLLGERYLDAHLPGAGAPLPATCVATRRVLAEVVRGTASATQRNLADSHLAECPACVAARDHLEVVNHRLRAGHVVGLAPAITAAKPIGLLARLVAWLFGSAPVITASVTLVLVAAIAPETPRRVDDPAPRSTPATVVPAEPVATSPSNLVDDPASRQPVAPTGRAPAVSTPAAGAATDPEVVPGPGTAPATPSPADPGAATPAGGVAPLPTVNLGPTVDGVTTGLGDTLGTVAQRVTETAEQTLLGLDDTVAGATQPLLDALPSAQADLQVGSVPLGPLGATPQVAVDASSGDGSVDLSLGAGPARLDLSIGGPSGLQASAPSAADLAPVLPAPNLAGPLLAPG